MAPLCMIIFEYKECAKRGWEEHKRRENEAMTVNAADKQRSVDDRNFVAITFDLQAVLYTPHAKEGPIYYKRKLAVYNFTVYDDGLKMDIVSCGTRLRESEEPLRLLLHCCDSLKHYQTMLIMFQPFQIHVAAKTGIDSLWPQCSIRCAETSHFNG